MERNAAAVLAYRRILDENTEEDSSVDDDVLLPVAFRRPKETAGHGLEAWADRAWTEVDLAADRPFDQKEPSSCHTTHSEGSIITSIYLLSCGKDNRDNRLERRYSNSYLLLQQKQQQQQSHSHSPAQQRSVTELSRRPKQRRK